MTWLALCEEGRVRHQPPAPFFRRRRRAQTCSREWRIPRRFTNALAGMRVVCSITIDGPPPIYSERRQSDGLAGREGEDLPRSSFNQSAYLVITSRRRSTAVILR